MHTKLYQKTKCIVIIILNTIYFRMLRNYLRVYHIYLMIKVSKEVMIQSNSSEFLGILSKPDKVQIV